MTPGPRKQLPIYWEFKTQRLGRNFYAVTIAWSGKTEIGRSTSPPCSTRAAAEKCQQTMRGALEQELRAMSIDPVERGQA